MDLKIASYNILDQLRVLIEELSSEYFTEQGPILNKSTIRYQDAQETVA